LPFAQMHLGSIPSSLLHQSHSPGRTERLSAGRQ
jgi:hypothetical protein